MPQYMGTHTVVAVSSTPNHKTPPMESGSVARACDTKEKPVCCVEMARSWR